MAEPITPQNMPYEAKLKPGKYWWCACGQSNNQPFCDGSHKGTEFMPKEFEVTEEKSYWLCGCKKTKNGPFCDGTHKG